MTTIEMKARIHQLPMTTTPENLETRFFTGTAVFVTYGDEVLMAGYSYQGRGNSSYFAAIYQFTTDNHTCEGEIKLTDVSNYYFPDNGHAIAWAMGHDCY